MAYTDTTVDVWIDAGRDSNNSWHLTSIYNVLQNLKKEVVLALPDLHVLTGFIYIPAFLYKGKIDRLELVMRINMYKECMNALGQDEIGVETFEHCEAF